MVLSLCFRCADFVPHALGNVFPTMHPSVEELLPSVKVPQAAKLAEVGNPDTGNDGGVFADFAGRAAFVRCTPCPAMPRRCFS